MKKTKLSLTEKKIAEMLTENTGTHFLDSGGAYGRNWERNQGRNFKAENETSFRASNGYLEITHNLFHWLSERLEYSPEWQRRFSRFANREEEQNNSWFETVDNFLGYLREKGHELGGIYGEGEPLTVNTYNGEDLLSQTIQYTYFTYNDSEVVIALFIHGGCDVRGGYTAPKFFTENGNYSELAILNNADARIYCQNKNDRHSWYTDDGCHFYGDNQEPDINGFRNSMEFIDFTDDENDYPFSIDKNEKGDIINVFHEGKIIDSPLKSFKGIPFNEVPIEEKLILPFDGETGKAFCPICGEELLAHS